MDDLDKMGGQADSNPWSEGEVALVPETAEQHSPLDASEAFLRGAAGLGGQVRNAAVSSKPHSACVWNCRLSWCADILAGVEVACLLTQVTLCLEVVEVFKLPSRLHVPERRALIPGRHWQMAMAQQ